MSAEDEGRITLEGMQELYGKFKGSMTGQPQERSIEPGLGGLCRSCVNKDNTVLARIRHAECWWFMSADLYEVDGVEYCEDYVKGKNVF